MLNKGWNIVKIPMEVISNNEFSIRRIYQSALFVCISSVQSLSRVWLCATPWISAGQVSLSIANSRSLPKLMSIELVMPSSHLILCLSLLFLPPIPPSIRVFPMSQFFAWGGQNIRVSASASVLPVNTQDWSPLGWTGWTVDAVYSDGTTPQIIQANYCRFLISQFKCDFFLKASGTHRLRLYQVNLLPL